MITNNTTSNKSPTTTAVHLASTSQVPPAAGAKTTQVVIPMPENSIPVIKTIIPAAGEVPATAAAPAPVASHSHVRKQNLVERRENLAEFIHIGLGNKTPKKKFSALPEIHKVNIGPVN